MELTIVTKAIAKLAPEFRAIGTTGAFMFGSRARGDHRPDSDLDIFIDYAAERRVPPLLGLMKLERQLSETLGVPVRITTRRSLHPKLKSAIEKDAVKML